MKDEHQAKELLLVFHLKLSSFRLHPSEARSVFALPLQSVLFAV
ncbi:MAG: hypothetical protein WKF30_03710 [Pyrinomonadaceae bacterium]